jgi:hypothetical protein
MRTRYIEFQSVCKRWNSYVLRQQIPVRHLPNTLAINSHTWNPPYPVTRLLLFWIHVTYRLKKYNKIIGCINTSNYYLKCEASLAKRFLHTAYNFKFNQVTLYNLSFPPASCWCLDRVLKSNTHTNKITFTLLSLIEIRTANRLHQKHRKKMRC